MEIINRSLLLSLGHQVLTGEFVVFWQVGEYQGAYKVLVYLCASCTMRSLTASSVSGTLQFVLPVWAPCCFLLTRGNVYIGLLQIVMSWLAIWWGSLYMSKHDRDYVTLFSSFIWLQVTKGLLQKFGPDRVLDTPITEVSGIEHMQAEHSSLLLLGL